MDAAQAGHRLAWATIWLAASCSTAGTLELDELEDGGSRPEVPSDAGDPGPDAGTDAGDPGPRDAAPVDPGPVDVGTGPVVCPPFPGGYEGRWVFEGGTIDSAPNPPPTPLGPCFGIGGQQHLSELRIDASGRFEGPLAADPDNLFVGCAIADRVGRLRLEVRACSGGCLGFDARDDGLGSLTWAPTGAPRVDVRVLGRAFAGDGSSTCSGCGPTDPPDPSCRTVEGVLLSLRYGLRPS